MIHKRWISHFLWTLSSYVFPKGFCYVFFNDCPICPLIFHVLVVQFGGFLKWGYPNFRKPPFIGRRSWATSLAPAPWNSCANGGGHRRGQRSCGSRPSGIVDICRLVLQSGPHSHRKMMLSHDFIQKYGETLGISWDFAC